MVVLSRTEGYTMGRYGEPDRYHMRCLIPWKADSNEEESFLERRFISYMISGRVYCIIWIIFLI